MVSSLTIRDLSPDDSELIKQISEMLVAEFREHHPGWMETIQKAQAEVHESFAQTESGSRISRIALNEKDEAAGWIGANRERADQ